MAIEYIGKEMLLDKNTVSIETGGNSYHTPAIVNLQYDQNEAQVELANSDVAGQVNDFNFLDSKEVFTTDDPVTESISVKNYFSSFIGLRIVNQFNSLQLNQPDTSNINHFTYEQNPTATNYPSTNLVPRQQLRISEDLASFYNPAIFKSISSKNQQYYGLFDPNVNDYVFFGPGHNQITNNSGINKTFDRIEMESRTGAYIAGIKGNSLYVSRYNSSTTTYENSFIYSLPTFDTNVDTIRLRTPKNDFVGVSIVYNNTQQFQIVTLFWDGSFWNTNT